MANALRARAEMVSAAPLLHHELCTGKTWEFRYRASAPWQPGNSLLFAKDLWRRIRFDDLRQRGIDSDFILRALGSGVAGVTIEDAPLTVCFRHGQTTGLDSWEPRAPDWRPWNGNIAGLLGADLPRAVDAYKGRSQS
jgi:hypothetical protein